MVSPKTDNTPEPRQRVARLMAKIQGERDRMLPNPSDSVRLAENAYLLKRLTIRKEFVESDRDLQEAKMKYRGALRTQFEADQTSAVAESMVKKILDSIEIAIANDQQVAPRTHSARRPNDMGPGYH